MKQLNALTEIIENKAKTFLYSLSSLMDSNGALNVKNENLLRRHCISKKKDTRRSNIAVRHLR